MKFIKKAPSLLMAMSLLLVILLTAACAAAVPQDADEANSAAEATESESADATSEDVAAEGEQIFRVGVWSGPQSFNPYITTDDYSALIFEYVYGQLIRFDENGVPVPYLAESFESSDDATEYTIHLREDAVWSDGTPVTAQDVEMSYRLHGNADVASIIAGNYAAIKGMEAYGSGEAESVEGLQIIDDKTIKFVLEEPNAPFINTLDYFVLPAHILGDVPPAELETHPFFEAPTVSAGAYEFVDYEPDQFIEFEANENFFLGEPQIERLIFRIGAQDVLLAQLQTDELDFALVPPAEVERVRSMENVSFVSVPGAGAQVVHFNLQKPYLQDKKFRQAVAYALPRTDIVDPLYFGEADVVNSPNAIGWAVPDDLNDYGYDPERARALLEEIGWDGSQTLLLRYPTGNKPREMSAPLIQSALGEVGIEVELEVTDFATLLTDVKEGNYDLSLLGWTGSGDPDLLATILYDSANVPPEGWNIMHYSNERVDELVREGRLTSDQGEREAIYQEMYSILNDELPVVFLWSENTLYAYNNRLIGFEPTQFGSWSTLASNAFPNIQELELAAE